MGDRRAPVHVLRKTSRISMLMAHATKVIVCAFTQSGSNDWAERACGFER